MSTIPLVPRSMLTSSGWRRSSIRTAVVAVVDGLLGWHERARQRRQLASLDDRQLHDIGISRSDAIREYYKPSWRP